MGTKNFVSATANLVPSAPVLLDKCLLSLNETLLLSFTRSLIAPLLLEAGSSLYHCHKLYFADVIGKWGIFFNYYFFVFIIGVCLRNCHVCD